MRFKLVIVSVSVVVAAAALLTVGGCASSSSTPAGDSSATLQSVKKFTAEDLKKLSWIEGAWRGTGAGIPPFFERYRLESDSVLAIESFENEKLEKVTDLTRYELKDGELGGGNEGYRWIASSIDDKSITFVPVAKARNSFRWEHVSKDEWKAVLYWPASGDKPAGERVYKMERIQNPKP